MVYLNFEKAAFMKLADMTGLGLGEVKSVVLNHFSRSFSTLKSIQYISSFFVKLPIE